MKWIVGNITTFRDADPVMAEHYYCRYSEIEWMSPYPTYGYLPKSTPLERILDSEKEAKYLTDKQGGYVYKVGDEVGVFVTIDQLHQTLIDKFPDSNIITYIHGRAFKDMLCIENGVNIGFDKFRGEWFGFPSGFYAYELWRPIEETIVRCYYCKKEYNLADIAETRNNGEHYIIPEDIYDLEINWCCDRVDLECQDAI